MKRSRVIMALTNALVVFFICYSVTNISSNEKSVTVSPKAKFSESLSVSEVSMSQTISSSATEIHNNATATPVLPCCDNQTEMVHIYEHPFSLLHVPTNTCQSNGAKYDPFLLVVIKSDVNHMAHRMAIRTTWGKASKVRLKFVFLLGYSPLLKTFIQMESNLYKDIIQETFLDDYRNNTMKTIMGFNWVSTNCPGAKYVLFVDDDYIVNIKYLWDHLNRLYVAGQHSIFTGFLWTNAKVERNIASKWYVSKEEFPDDVWPAYVSGGSMVITTDIVANISNNFKFVKPLFIDDAYLGIVAQKLKIVLIHEERFWMFYPPDRMGYLFSSHQYKSPKTLVDDWARFHIKLDMVV